MVAVDSAALAQAFGELISIARHEASLPPYWHAEMAELRAWPLEGLRALWDAYDGTNAPLGFDGETIYATLNERGDGSYCAV